jgi:hypothetical protein
MASQAAVDTLFVDEVSSNHALVSISTALFIGSSLSVNEDCDMGMDLSTSGVITAGGAISASDTLLVENLISNTLLFGNRLVTSSDTTTGSLSVLGRAVMGSSCSTIQLLTSRLSVDAVVGSSVSLSGSLSVSAPTYLEDLSASGHVQFANVTAATLSVDGQALFGKSVSVYSDCLAHSVSLEDGLTVGGGTHLEEDLILDASFVVAGPDASSIAADLMIGGMLSVHQQTLISSVSVANRSVLFGEISVGSDALLGSTLSVNGFSFLNESVHVLTSLQVDSSIEVSGSASFWSTVNVDGEIALSDRVVSGSTISANEVSFGLGGLSVAGPVNFFSTLVSIEGLTLVKGSLSASGTMFAGTGVSVDENLRFGSVFEISAGNESFISGDASTHTGYLHGVWISEAPVTTSDLRFKHNIKPLIVEIARKGNYTNATELLHALRPVAFSMGKSGLDRRFGFIAQEIEKVAPDLVFTSNDTDSKGVLYQDIIAILVGAFQEHLENVEILRAEEMKRKEKLKKLESQRHDLTAMIEEQSRIIESLKGRLSSLERLVNQNRNSSIILT